MLVYLQFISASRLRINFKAVHYAMEQLDMSEWYVLRATRILRKLGVIRLFERDGVKVIEIVNAFHEKTVNALKGLNNGSIVIDPKSEEIVHKKSGRTLDLSGWTPARELSADNRVVSRQPSCPQTTVVPSQLGTKSVSADSEQASLFSGDRKDEAKTCAGGLSDIDILSSNRSIGNNTSSIGTNTKISDKPNHGGRPSFQWVEGEDPEMDEVWKFWRDTLYPKRKAPNSNDWSRIRCRLRDGASVEEMKQVILHAKNDPWLNGTDPNNRRGKRYDSIEVLFNSHSKFEKYLADAETSKTAIQRDVRGIDLRARPSNDGQTTNNVRL